MAEPAKAHELIMKHIQKALGGRAFVCGLCGGTRWQLLDGIGYIILGGLQDNPGNFRMVGDNKATAISFMTCETCGHMVWLNLGATGLLQAIQARYHTTRGTSILSSAEGAAT